jgi:hypothetical protein
LHKLTRGLSRLIGGSLEREGEATKQGRSGDEGLASSLKAGEKKEHRPQTARNEVPPDLEPELFEGEEEQETAEPQSKYLQTF